MNNRGIFVTFESGSKGGKTTLTGALSTTLRDQLTHRQVTQGRSALTESPFASEVKRRNITSLEYSTAFYWADLVFHTHDSIVPNLKSGDVVVYDRYDVSILAYREAYGLHDDDLLLDGFVARGMILNPDLTVFLNPPLEVMLDRINKSEDGSDIDRAFLNSPQRLAEIQRRTEHHLVRMNRKFVTLDTALHDVDQCVDQLLTHIQPMLESE